MSGVDKARVRRAFSRGAGGYDRHARVQRAVQGRVLAALAEAAPATGRALDVGAGTGALLAGLAALRPGLSLSAVDLAPGMCAAARAAVPGCAVAAGDAERLPFATGTFDVVVSTSTLQWVSHLDGALAELRRVLRPGGLLVVATFGERTLHELRDAWRRAAPAGRDHTHRFPSLGTLAAAVRAAGLDGASLREELVVDHLPDARAVLRSLKAIGASNAAPGRSGLGGRTRTLDALRRYEDHHRGPSGVPATYHVLHATARAPATDRGG